MSSEQFEKSTTQELSLSSWNIRGGLSDPDRAFAITNTLIQQQNDIVVLADAWREDSSRSSPSGRRLLVTANDFYKNGYEFIDADFEEDRPDDNYAHFHFTTLVKQGIQHQSEVFRLGERPATHITTSIGAAAIHIVGLHLNDQDERTRSHQVTDLLSNLSKTDNQPTILAGDFNALQKESVVARTLRTGLARSTIGRLSIANSTFPRLIEMASGSTLQSLEAAGFIDTNSQPQPTAPSRTPVFQLDRFMHKITSEVIDVRPITVHKHSSLSDHRQISTALKYIGVSR